MSRLALACLTLAFALAGGLAIAADQALLGKSLVVRSAPATGLRHVSARAVEPAGGATLSGDPTTPPGSSGGVLHVELEGTTPTRQTFVLPPGIARDGRPFWRSLGGAGFTFVDRFGEHGPVRGVLVRGLRDGAWRPTPRGARRMVSAPLRA